MLHLNARTPVWDWKAAQWLPVYLVGVGLIVYFSDYGPLKNPPIKLWYDMGAVAIFSLIIYYWAIAVSLPADKIKAMITEVVPDEDVEFASMS